jgi:hypothetical protein
VIGNQLSEVHDPNGYVSVLLGNGDGSFQPDQRLDLTDGVHTVSALRDINRDGNIDILLSNGYLLPGNGDGSFEPGQPFSPGGPVVLGDVNGDGVDDLVSSEQGISVMLGNGDGSYQEAFRIGTSGVKYTIALADIYGNGRLDILFVEQRGYGSSLTSTLKILPNRSNNR